MRNLRLSTERNLKPSSPLRSMDTSAYRAVFSSMMKRTSTFCRLPSYSLSRSGISLILTHLHLAIYVCKECLNCHYTQWKCSQDTQWNLWDISADKLIEVYSISRWLTLLGDSFLESSAERSKIVVQSLTSNPSRLVVLNFSRLHQSKYFCQNQDSGSTFWSWTYPKVIIP